MAQFDFNKEVVELSFQKPVVIDFWANWCGPCKVLGPVLDELEKEDNGKWVLVKIDTEVETEIAEYFRIQSIPHCKLVSEGKIIDEFSGAQSKATIRQWLNKHLSAIIAEEAIVELDDFDELIELQQSIPDKEMMNKIVSFLQAHPENEKALLAYLKHEVFFHPEITLKKVKNISDQKLSEEFEQYFNSVKEFVQIDSDKENKTNQLLIQAKEALFNNNGQLAIDKIIESVIADKQFHNELPRRIGIALFNIWGKDSELTKENRKLFDMAIW